MVTKLSPRSVADTVARLTDGHQTKVSYTAPTELASRYELADELASRLAGIDAVTNAVIDG